MNKKMKINIYQNFKKTNKILVKIFRYIPSFNKAENEELTAELSKRFKELQEQNSQDLFTFHYIPMAVKKLLKEKKEINNSSLRATATMLLIDDMSKGIINEFYWFNE